MEICNLCLLLGMGEVFLDDDSEAVAIDHLIKVHGMIPTPPEEKEKPDGTPRT